MVIYIKVNGMKNLKKKVKEKYYIKMGNIILVILLIIYLVMLVELLKWMESFMKVKLKMDYQMVKVLKCY